ncbi:MAG: hypothetical protein ACI9WS_000820 [Paraglaciecola psychrophila]|jgi:uncharacterized protein YdiU (UPF0061 family)
MEFSQPYLDLGERFYQRSEPSPVAAPSLLLFNNELAERLQLSAELRADSEALAELFSGNTLLPGSTPVAAVYAGHQFGNFNPQLGDGRAHLLGALSNSSGQVFDLQLKGSGQTPYSRGGDGRCAIGPAIREFIMSQSMLALRVPTTECLAVVGTGEPVYRDGAVPGAVVTRVASSHLRVGSFQYFAAKDDQQSLDTLCNYAIKKHFPAILQQPQQRYTLLLEAVIDRQIALVVEWMRVGFIHGVMNTDNCAISGDTIDYGPCAMMGVYQPNTVYSSIDRMGRYAFGNQPTITHWNMTRFAECLLQLVERDPDHSREQLEALLSDFPARFSRRYYTMLAAKFGLTTSDSEKHKPLIDSLLAQFAAKAMDYTLTFNDLGEALTNPAIAAQMESKLGAVFGSWQQTLAQQEDSNEMIKQSMADQNPLVIPRNHHLEAVLRECEQTASADAAEQFLSVLRSPYKNTAHTGLYQDVAADGDSSYQTFCGT